MKIGIIVYSYTNNTLRIANELESSLSKHGFDVEVQRITAVDENPNASSYNMLNLPSCEPYDVIIFGTCVRGFDCAPIFKQYMQKLETLEHKKVAGYVSQYFPFDVMGGNQSLKCMERLVKSKGTDFYRLGSIHMKFRDYDEQFKNLIEQCIKWLNT